MQERMKQGERTGTPKASPRHTSVPAGAQAAGVGPLWAAPPAVRLGGAPVQRMAEVAESEGPQENLGQRIQARAGSGQALEPEVQRKLETGLGADMSSVRVHTDSEAHGMARSAGAIAFTSGSDIYFQSGQFNPGSGDGMRLLAHEAAHTVQQAAGPVSGRPMAGGVNVSDPGDSFERAADQAAERVMSHPATPVQRQAEEEKQEERAG